MKKHIVILFIAIASLSACTKNSANSQAEVDAYNAQVVAAQAAYDESAIQNYLAKSSTSAIRDPSGLYYQVTTAGTGDTPTASSSVTINYTGKLLSNDVVFGTGTNTVLALNSVISGFTIGLQHVKVGGTIVLYVPSALAYGPLGNGTIPGNSVLIFTVNLLSLK